MLYVDPELTYLKDLELSGASTTEKSDSSYDGRNGVRSIRISPDGKHLASGDRAGNIRYAPEILGLCDKNRTVALALLLYVLEVTNLNLRWKVDSSKKKLCFSSASACKCLDCKFHIFSFLTIYSY